MPPSVGIGIAEQASARRRSIIKWAVRPIRAESAKNAALDVQELKALVAFRGEAMNDMPKEVTSEAAASGRERELRLLEEAS